MSETSLYLKLNLLEYVLRPQVIRTLYCEVYGGDLERLLALGVSEWESHVRFTAGEKKALALKWPLSQKKIEKDMETLERLQTVLIAAGDPRYPALLAQLPDAPFVLFARGRLDILACPHSLAVVGSRDMSPYGARALAMILGGFNGGPCLASGLALGVDAAVHTFALDRGLPTVGVLGCGLDEVYPPENATLFARMFAQGLVLSEFPLGTPPMAQHFPRRNRIIAGLALGVLVVEAALKSGSLITARFATEYNREVFAVPGPIDAKQSAGCHRLIARGARLVTGASDLAAELPALDVYVADETRPAKESIPCVRTSFSINLEDLDPTARVLYLRFEQEPKWHIDTLAEALKCLPPALFPHLLALEAKGYLRAAPGQWYERK